MIILINDIKEITKELFKSKNKIIINSDLININAVVDKLQKLNIKYKLLNKDYKIQSQTIFTSNFAIQIGGCYIIYDEEFIGYKPDAVENKEKTLNELNNIAENYNVKMGLTIGNLSKNIFKKISNFEIKIDKYILVRILKGYHGGVIMRPKKSNYKKIVEYDMRSAYPYQIKNKKFMLGTFYVYNKPVGELFIVNFSYTKIKINNNNYDILENINIFKDLKNNYNITLTCIEFEYIIKNYTITNFKINYYINSTINDYINDGDFIDTFYKIKTNARSNAEKTASKLILNSLVGKLAQRKYNIKDRDIREDTLPISVFVNAYQRVYIANIINKNINNIIYSDTDSIFTKEKIKDIKTDTKKIGSWKLEKEYKKIKFFAKRQYIADNTKHLAGLATEIKKKHYDDLYKLDNKHAYNIKNINKRNETLGIYTIINKIEK